MLELENEKWVCRGCGRSFWQRFPGILPRMRASEPFRRSVCQKHFDGISRSRLAQREGSQRHDRTLVRLAICSWWRRSGPARRVRRSSASTSISSPGGIGYATTFCDLKNHKVHDVVLGRSEASLEGYLATTGRQASGESRLHGSGGRLPRPGAQALSLRPASWRIAFTSSALVNHHFLACWKRSGSGGIKESRADFADAPPPAKSHCRSSRRLSHYLRGRSGAGGDLPLQTAALLPAAGETAAIQKRCRKLAPRLLRDIAELRGCGLAPLVQLGNTLHSWREEIACMWRFTRNNGITEGFHTKMEVLQRQAYGFRNFQNYRLRVKVLCS